MAGKHIRAAINASDSEYEEEETLVLVELQGLVNPEVLQQDTFSKFRLIGMETANPILQLENFVFEGEYEETLGTDLFFEEEGKKTKKSDPVFCKKPPQMLRFNCKTNKKLIMKRVFVTEKVTPQHKENSTSTEKNGSDRQMTLSEIPDCSDTCSESILT